MNDDLKILNPDGLEINEEMIIEDIQAQEENNEELLLQDEFNEDGIDELLGEGAEIDE